MRLVPTLLAASAALALSAPALAHPVTYIGTLSAAAENNPADNSLGTGNVTVVFDDDSFTMRVQVAFSGMLTTKPNGAPSGVTASHIHCCTTLAGTGNAGVATPVPTFPGFPLGGQSGSYDQTFNLALAGSWNPAYITANGGTVASAFSAFSTGLEAGKAYLNIHSDAIPGGEIRAFLVAAPVPEPETYALMLAGLALVGGVVGRRRQQR